MLKRDKRWETFYGDVSLEQFANEKLPLPLFKKVVNKEIVSSFAIVHQLLIHSYYQYLFVDIAVTRALHIFEMALCIRYKELNNGEEWDLKKKSLINLIDWFNERLYFEIANKDFLNHVRSTRNYLTHPKGSHFAGSVGLPWIYTVVDLINGLYEDIELRKERWKSTKENKSKLDLFLLEGARLTILNKIYYIYNSGPLKIENRLKPHKCYFSLLPLFDAGDTIPKIPLIFHYPSNALDFNNPTVELSLGAQNITLSNELNLEELDMIAKFRTSVENEEEYRIQNSMLIFAAGIAISESVGEALDYSVMLEQEFTIDVKINATLETRREHLTSPFSPF